MAEYSRLTFEVDKHIAVISFNRPDKHNGIDKSFIDDLLNVSKQIKRDRSIRAVILRGLGDSFCSGLDFQYVAKNPSIIPKYFLKLPWRSDNKFQRVGQCLRNLPVPVIASIHGNCFGGGFQIALGCDVRIAHSNTVFSVMEMKWGLIPDMSGMVNLSRLTREDVAKELVYTGRKFTAEEALSFGLTTKVSDSTFDDSMHLAQKIAQQSPDAVTVAKQLLQSTWKKSERLTLLLERLHQLRVLGRKNNRLAMKAGMSKNKDAVVFNNRRVN